MHFMSGGLETVYRMVNNLVHLLVSHPDEMQRLKADRELIPDAIEEAMRFEGVVSSFSRMALEDVDVCGTLIPAGSMVHVIHAAVNRDPDRWVDPHVFDITRNPLPNLSFGFGRHTCLGIHLARVEMAHFLELVMHYMPNLRWDSALTEPPRITGWATRSALELPVEWDT